MTDSEKQVESFAIENKNGNPCTCTCTSEQPKRSRSKKFFEDSTFNGALYVFASSSWIKRIFWGVIVVIAIGGFLAVTINDIIRLVREPIATSITLTREAELDFPSVTLCSLSHLNTTTLINTGGSNIIDGLQSLFAEVQDNSNMVGCKSIANVLVRDIGNLSWGQLTTSAENDLAALLLNCSYAGEKCSANDFRPINTVTGRCYTFNRPDASQQARTARGTGLRQGLRLQLTSEGQFFSQTNDHGYRIVIHNSDEVPIPESEGIVVGLQSTVYIGMNQVTSIDRTKFSSGHDCRGENSKMDQDLTFPGYTAYSPGMCRSECFYRNIADRCGCIEGLFYTPVSIPYNQLRECSLPDLCCEVEAFDAVEDACDCPPRCETVDRTFTISSSTHDNGHVGVFVYYESLILETRETTDSYDAWSLISDIGGNTGLFLGFTLLSGVELIMYVLGLMKDCCCRRKRSNKH